MLLDNSHSFLFFLSNIQPLSYSDNLLIQHQLKLSICCDDAKTF